MHRFLMRLSPRFHDDMGTGKVVSRIMSDVDAIRNMVTMNTISIVNDVVNFVFALVVILWINPALALVALMILPLYYLNYRFFVPRIRGRNVAVRRKMDQVANELYERISGAKLVRAFAKERYETSEFLSQTRSVMGVSMEGVVLSTSFYSVSEMINGIGGTVVYCLGCYFVIQGRMTYGDILVFMVYIWRVLGPALRFTTLSNEIEQALVSVDRVFEVLDTQPEIKETPDAVALPPIKGHVVFEHVCFEYVEGEPVLKDVNLDVPAGSTVALVGHTGCGKTTVTSLLLRFYNVKSGRILIDGHDISKVTLDSLRGQIGQVLQDSVLFSGTVRDNLRYGKKDATEEEILRAAKVAEIHTFIATQPDGYDSWLGRAGVKFSMGEKQRMSIARAVATDPGILVLDEATSSLDSQSEALIQKALESVMRDRTSFVIAHRLSTIVNADKIVVMDKGEIVETGTHSELVERQDGFYRKLYEQQFAARKRDVFNW
jgi:ABC-type multidrug transport system fused ATPase/permease subunit